jgi:hypothetical protein
MQKRGKEVSQFRECYENKDKIESVILEKKIRWKRHQN